MNREHSSKGYKVVANTTPATHQFYGLTVIAEAVISRITAPTAITPERTAYDGDESGIASQTLPVGYYPIRGSAITLTSGKVILWTE